MKLKKTIFCLLLAAVAALAVGAFCMREREAVILSTNDIHSNINRIPRLAAAVALCRDTVATVLVDAGDRWTGNCFVDRAEGRRPILDLMNRLGYDGATLGNHEFDCGPSFLAAAVGYCRFPVVCANVNDAGAGFPQLDGSFSVRLPHGPVVSFTGVVSTAAHGHPEGKDAVFEGLHFDECVSTAVAAGNAAAERGVDARVLLSHAGYANDMDIASATTGYALIIGGHSHDEVDTLVCGTPIGQTGCQLANVGVTRIRYKGRRITSLEYENIPLEGYAPDAAFEAEVQKIRTADPDLNAVAGSFASAAELAGLANIFTESLAAAAAADIGIYHHGGIRRKRLPEEDDAGMQVLKGDIYNLEPFGTEVYVMSMTPEQMRTMIIAKYNQSAGFKEAHRVDIRMSVPYDLIVDQADTAQDVIFPTLVSGRAYKVAMSGYMFDQYPFAQMPDSRRLLRADGTPVLVTDILSEWFGTHSPVEPSNDYRQFIVNPDGTRLQRGRAAAR